MVREQESLENVRPQRIKRKNIQHHKPRNPQNFDFEIWILQKFKFGVEKFWNRKPPEVHASSPSSKFIFQNFKFKFFKLWKLFKNAKFLLPFPKWWGSRRRHRANYFSARTKTWSPSNFRFSNFEFIKLVILSQNLKIRIFQT